jgi:hypothetical protein
VPSPSQHGGESFIVVVVVSSFGRVNFLPMYFYFPSLRVLDGAS